MKRYLQELREYSECDPVGFFLLVAAVVMLIATVYICVAEPMGWQV